MLFSHWTGADYLKELGESHVFLLPSLRESAGITMMEAMLAGCVPVVADCGGPAHIVTDDCGWKIPVGGRAGMIDALAEAIATLDRDREPTPAGKVPWPRNGLPAPFPKMPTGGP